jgi:putative PIN family toxin of toxin-antitoxin system
MRIVLDTDVLVAAFQSDAGASRALILAVLAGRARALLSTPLILEYEAVLTRPEVLARAGVAEGDVLEFLDDLAGRCVAVGFDFSWRPVAADPDDDFVLETAINGGAAAIATFNVKHLAAAAARFGILALRPADLLRRLP